MFTIRMLSELGPLGQFHVITFAPTAIVPDSQPQQQEQDQQKQQRATAKRRHTINEEDNSNHKQG